MEASTSDADRLLPGGYRRDAFTWAVYRTLGGFGLLNAVLGPALPYLRETEHISYLTAAAHQVAFAVGGGLAGLIAARARRGSRAVLIRVGLVGAALAGLGVGYGDHVVITVLAAFVMSLFGTSALIRLWAALSDAHRACRSVAMTEGEVSVSLGGIVAPLLIGGFAATALSWRFAFVVGAAMVLATVAGSGAVRIPPPARAAPRPADPGQRVRRRFAAPVLIAILAIVALEFSLSFWLASYLNTSVGVDRGVAVSMVAGLYAANLLGRLAASRFARRVSTARLLLAALGVGLAGVSILLAATDGMVAAIGLAVAGIGIGATFPLASSLHVGASSRSADTALGQILATAAVGQILGPLAVAVIAEFAGLRVGLLVLPGLAVLAAAIISGRPVAEADLRDSGRS